MIRIRQVSTSLRPIKYRVELNNLCPKPAESSCEDENQTPMRKKLRALSHTVYGQCLEGLSLRIPFHLELETASQEKFEAIARASRLLKRAILGTQNSYRFSIRAMYRPSPGHWLRRRKLNKPIRTTPSSAYNFCRCDTLSYEYVTA
jgi:hypothetical protein